MDEDFIVSFLQRATWRVKTFILCCKWPLEGWGFYPVLVARGHLKGEDLSCPCCKWPLERWGLYPVPVASGHLKGEDFILSLLQVATWIIPCSCCKQQLERWGLLSCPCCIWPLEGWGLLSCRCCKWPLEGWGLHPVLVASGHLRGEDFILSLLQVATWRMRT